MPSPNSTAARQPTLGGLGARDRMRLLDVFSSCKNRPLTISDLRERGIDRPGEAIYELRLAGYPVERVCAGRRGSTVPGYRLSARAAHRDTPDCGDPQE